MTFQTCWVWHGHHQNGSPLELLPGTLDDRIRAIHEKPPREVTRRLRLLQPVRGQLPGALYEAQSAYEKAETEVDRTTAARDGAREAYEQARSATNESVFWLASSAYRRAIAARTQAGLNRDEAQARVRQVIVDHLPAVLVLHAAECLDCPWDGWTIFPAGQRSEP